MKRVRSVLFVKRVLLFVVAPLLLIAVTGIITWRDKGRALPSSWRKQAKKLYVSAKTTQLLSSFSHRAFATEQADEPFLIYGDHLHDGWSDWSWASHELYSTEKVDDGKFAVAMRLEPFKGIYFHCDGMDTSGYGDLEMSVYVETPAPKGALLIAGAQVGSNAFTKQVPCSSLSAGWNQIRVSLSALGINESTVSGFVIQDGGKSSSRTLYLDSIRLLPDKNLPLAPISATVAVQVNPAENRHPISPFIYGVAHLGADKVKAWHLGSHRWGGNPNSRYNWQTNNGNAARDWEFRNSGDDQPKKPAGAAVDQFVRANRAAGVATVLTIPTIGWIAKDGNHQTRSIGVPGDGGPLLAGSVDGAISGYSPLANRKRTSVRSVAREIDAHPGDVAQDTWVRHLVATHGTAAQGGVPIYAMDNEPDLWSQTHTDVRPARMGYEDVLSNFLEYATAVKDVDETAMITGPVSWGWTGYFYSALDKGNDNYHTHADRDAHGGEAFLPWFLRNVRMHDERAGRRTLDILDVHYYPQGQNIYSPQADTATREKRLRATRALWDESYVDESWINEPVRLVPRLKEWIAGNYPGTKIGITEWNFGADRDISGGLAILETLGVFGREGIYLANYWTAPLPDTPGYWAFQLLRNADGFGHGFGDMSCEARSTDSSHLSSFAATDSKTGDLTVLLINKMRKATITTSVSLKSRSYDSVPCLFWLEEYGKMLRTESANRVRGGSFSVVLPPYSAVLVRFPKGKDK